MSQISGALGVLMVVQTLAWLNVVAGVVLGLAAIVYRVVALVT